MSTIFTFAHHISLTYETSTIAKVNTDKIMVLGDPSKPHLHTALVSDMP
jgi:hypothetical protein